MNLSTISEMNLSWIDLTVIAGYAVFVILFGLYHARRENAEEYFMGGKNMSWVMVGMSMFATCVSSSALIGWSGDAYSTGISVFNYGLSGAIFVLVVFLVFFLPLYLRTRIFTLPEFLEKRFDVRSRWILTGMSVLGYTFLDISVTLYAGALMLKMVFPNMEIWQLIIGLAVFSASFTLVGGLSSVMYTDALQAIILFGGSVVLTITAFVKAGGWSHVMQSVPPESLSLIRPVDDPSVPWPALLTTLPLLGFYFWGTSQMMVQRTLSAKDTNHGRWGNLFAAALNFGIFFFMILPGIAGYSLFPDLEKGDLIYPTLVTELMPVGLAGLMVAAILSAMGSTLSSLLNSTSTLITRDVFHKFHPNMSGKQEIAIGAVVGVVVMLIAVCWAPQIDHFEGVVKYFQQILSYMAPPVVTVFVGGVFWKRANGTGAFATLFSGALVGLLLLLFLGKTPLANLHFLYIAPIVFLFSVVVFVVASLCSAAPEPEKIRDFVWRRSLYTEETAELKALPFYKNYRYLSLALIMVTLIFMWIWR